MIRTGNLVRALGALAVAVGALTAPTRADEDPKQYVQFVEEFAGNCVARSGVQILVKSTHPKRTLRVWLDRYYMGKPTADRSHSDLAPGGEPEPLGCSRAGEGAQEWRVVRAVFVD